MLVCCFSRRPTILSFVLLFALSIAGSGAALAKRPVDSPTGPQGPINAGPLDQTTRAAFPKWSGVVDRASAWQSVDVPGCGTEDEERCGLEPWRAFLTSLQGKSPKGWVDDVQTYVNQVRYQDDSKNWRTRDYWAAPDQFFTRGGDCEDYAIAKFYSLKLMGFPLEQMRIVVLIDQRLRIAHAVLEVRLGDDAFVLDNRFNKVMSWRELSHYRPIYSVNETNYWVHAGNSNGMTWELPATAAGVSEE